MTRRRNPDIDPRLLAADGARYFSPEALAEADEEGSGYKSRVALVLMHPQDFLDMAEPGKREEAQASLERVIGAGIGFAGVPRLFVDVDGDDPRIAHVTGHEGRHRSRALLARGVTQMPVRIHSQTIRWSEQSDPKARYYKAQLPERLYGEGENRRNVLPMPVPLHYPELAPRMRAAARVNPSRRRNPDAEVWYHGRKARSRKFDLQFVGGREATNQEGPGFYFTTSPEEATVYTYPNGVVLRATLNVPKWVSRTKRPVRSEIERLMRASPNYEDALTDWDESPYRAHAKALAVIMQKPNQMWNATVKMPMSQLRKCVGVTLSSVRSCRPCS